VLLAIDGLLRDWLPKGSDFSKVTKTRLAQIQKMLNNRPRKCLNYRWRSSTPYPALRFGVESAYREKTIKRIRISVSKPAWRD